MEMIPEFAGCLPFFLEKSMKSISLALLLVATSVAAHGSYELLMQIDNSGVPAVRRIDPYTGASFGSFGGGYLRRPQSLAYRNGVVYVLDTVGNGVGQGRIQRYNPSTGELLGVIPLPGTWGKVNDGSTLDIDSAGNFFVSDAGASGGNISYVNQYTPNGGYLAGRFWSTSGSNAFDTGIALNEAKSRLYVANDASGSIDVYNTTASSEAIQSVVTPGKALWMTSNNGFLYYTTNTATGVAHRISINASTGALGTITDFNLAPGMINSRGFGIGHTPVMYTSQFDGTKWSISRFNSETLDFMGSVAAGVNANPWGNIVVITAPEPSTMVVLGLSTLVLWRRKRSS